MAAETFELFMQRREAAAKEFVRGDAGPVVALCVRQDPATFFGPDGGLKQGVQAVLADFRQGAANFGRQSDTYLEVLQQYAGDQVGFWTGYQHSTVEMKDGKKVPMKLRVTEVFRVEDGEWRLSHRHADRAKEQVS